VAGAQLVRAPHRHDGRILEWYAQHGQVGIRIHADDLRRGDAAVGQLYADLVRALDDVVIGDDVAGLIDDDAGAEAALDALTDRGRMLPQQGIAPGGPGGGGIDDTRRINVDDGRAGSPHGVGKRASWRGITWQCRAVVRSRGRAISSLTRSDQSG